MSSSTILNPRAPAYHPRGYVSSSQALPLSNPAFPHYYPNLFQPPPPPPAPQPPTFIYSELSSPRLQPPPPPPPPPQVTRMHDGTHLPGRDNAYFARRGWFGRGGRRSGQGSRGGFSRQQSRAYDRRNNNGDSSVPNDVSEEMSRMRIVEPRDVSKKRKPVVPVKCDDNVTTVMIRNIPNKYTRELLIEFLDNHCKVENEKEENESDSSHVVSAYDFVYLPLDFRRKANLGYAFVNFTDPRAVWRFHKSKNNQMWELFYSSKVREVATAKLQGKEQLMKHFENTLFACESDEFLPVAFSPPRDGTNKSVKQHTVGMRR